MGQAGGNAPGSPAGAGFDAHSLWAGKGGRSARGGLHKACIEGDAERCPKLAALYSNACDRGAAKGCLKLGELTMYGLSCIGDAFKGLSFPPPVPQGSMMLVSYAINFNS